MCLCRKMIGDHDLERHSLLGLVERRSEHIVIDQDFDIPDAQKASE